jgi:hypothetical protein
MKRPGPRFLVNVQLNKLVSSKNVGKPKPPTSARRSPWSW